jgi:putative PIG3 family NAD(P)H quinone oxidoreductase
MNPYDIKIKVAAIGLNRADLYIQKGMYRKGAKPGMEVSGTVTNMGKEARRFAIGDKVCALVEDGFNPIVTVIEAMALPAPANLPLTHAAALPEAMATVYLNLFLLARLKPTDSLLVHGGTSGIGIMAIQMARTIGAEVSVTCGSPEKCALAIKLGATKAINYKQDDFVAAGGFDIILDMVGAPYLQKNIDALNPFGKLLIIGLIEGSKAELPMGKLLLKNLSIIGSTFSSRPLQERYEILETLREFWWPKIESGEIRPIIDGTFPLTDVAKAFEKMENFKHTGKILLIP